MKLNKIFALLSASALAVTSFVSCSIGRENPTYNITKKQLHKIGIVQLTENSQLNTVRDTIVETLAELGYVDKENCSIEIKNANGEPSAIEQILEQFKNDETNVIVAIGTTSAQLAVSYSEEIPVVFSAVKDPVGAGVVTSLKKPGGNITGVSDKISVNKILTLAEQIKPDIETLGFMYSTSDDNSVSCLLELREYCEKNDITLRETKVTTSSQVYEKASRLAEKCDAVFVPDDQIVSGSLDKVSQALKEPKIPLFVASGEMAKYAGLATMGIEYSEVGVATADMVAKILSGEKTAGEISVKTFDKSLKTYVNVTVAKELGIEIPDEILGNENTVVLK